MIILSGTLKATDERLDALASAMRTVLEETRREAGCIVYSFARDVLEPGLLRIYEEWESRELLAAHVKTAHVAAWHKALADAGGAEANLHLIEVSSVEDFG
ncbi:putative quinol monooxygenase [Aureimonas sp. AU40]|uniref:putative quinol monooxygenase n=1 Tax=Aureimonas sp. AU40 TaxID=1637747 RepID=UPI000781C105|nr:putative quinol monooxygenase [Aureimonas sp. AU40]